jgi:hypothetical protein
MLPTDRNSLKLYCLRKLGYPIVTINIDPEQIEDRIDEAITRFQTFHYDGKVKWYTSHQITTDDMTNRYVTMDDNVIGVTRIFILQGSSTVSTGEGFNMWDINYQIRLNELYDYTAGDYTYFELANEHLRMLEMMFTGEIPIRYNRYENKLYIDADWPARFAVGRYIVIEHYRVLDSSTKFWQDDFLLRYTTCLIKRQWGENLKLFNSVTLPGGMILNGQRIYDEAVEEQQKLERQLRDEFEDPPEWYVG